MKTQKEIEAKPILSKFQFAMLFGLTAFVLWRFTKK